MEGCSAANRAANMRMDVQKELLLERFEALFLPFGALRGVSRLDETSHSWPREIRQCVSRFADQRVAWWLGASSRFPCCVLLFDKSRHAGLRAARRHRSGTAKSHLLAVPGISSGIALYALYASPAHTLRWVVLS